MYLFLVVDDVLQAFLGQLPLKHLLLDRSRRHKSARDKNSKNAAIG